MAQSGGGKEAAESTKLAGGSGALSGIAEGGGGEVAGKVAVTAGRSVGMWILAGSGSTLLILITVLFIIVAISMAASSVGQGGSNNGGGGTTASGSCEKPTGTPKNVIDKVALPIAHEIAFKEYTPEHVEAANAAHSTSTTSGNLSDHKGPPERAWAADISNGSAPTKEMDQLAKNLAECFDIPWSGSGLVSSSKGGYRYQLIYRTNEGGNHFNHVHIGVAAE